MTVIQKIKKISIWVVCIILGLIITASVISYIYKDKIIRFVTEELASEINGKVNIGEIDISFFSSFPNVSIQLHNVTAQSTPSFKKEDFSGINTTNAVSAGKIMFTFNIIDFFNERYIVQEIKIKNAYINFLLDSNGNTNFEFIKESADTSKKQYFVELSRISFYKTTTEFHSASQQLYAKDYFDYAFFSGKFLDSNFALFIDSEFTSNEFRVKNNSYFKNLDLDLEISVAKTNNLYQILTADIETEFADISTKGNVRLKKDGTNVDLTYKLEIPDIRELSPVLPNSVTKIFTEQKLSGELISDGTISGMISEDNLPRLHANITYNDGSIKYDKDTYDFSTKGVLSTANMGMLSQYSYTNASISLTRNETKVSGSLTLKDFNRFAIDFKGSIDANLEDLAEYIQPDEYVVAGKAKGKLSFSGLLSELNSFTPDFFNRTNTELHLNLSDITVTPPSYSPYGFNIVSGKLTCKNQDVQLDSIRGTMQGSNFTFSGSAPNLLNYIMFDGQDASVTGKAYIDAIDVNPFMKHYYDYIANLPSTATLSTFIDCISKKVVYDTYTFTDVSSKLIYTGDVFALNNTSLKALQGTYSGDVKFTYFSNGTSKCEVSGDIKKMSAKDLFKTFNNFDQEFLKENQINGKISTKFTYASMLDKDYNPEYKTMNILCNVLIEDGSIKDFEPFIEMGKKLKIEEFNTVTFTKIENTLRIDKDTLYIPNMKIRTNAFEMDFAGKHTISNNQFNYFITLFLKKTLSSVFKKKNNVEDFGEIEQNTDGNLRIPVHIYGNPDKYTVDYDMKTSVKNVKQGFEKQKEEWKAILGKEEPNEENPNQNTTNPSNQPKQDKPKEKPIDNGFQIEYD